MSGLDAFVEERGFKKSDHVCYTDAQVLQKKRRNKEDKGIYESIFFESFPKYFRKGDEGRERKMETERKRERERERR